MMYEELVKWLRSHYCGVHAKAFKDAADAIEDLQNERDVYSKAMTDEHNRAAKIAWEHRWIPVTERLPEKYTRVLVYSKRIRLGRNIDFMNEDGDWHTIPEVSYWMPLPEPPKEET